MLIAFYFIVIIAQLFTVFILMISGPLFRMSKVLSSQTPFILRYIQIWCIKTDILSVHPLISF